MVKLQDMRNPRKLRWPMYFFFALIIISFVFFYGWRPSEAELRGSYARMRSDSINPFNRWTVIHDRHLRDANQRLLQQKAMLLPSYIVEYFQHQQGGLDQILNQLVSLDEIAREAANMIILERESDRLGVRVARQEIIDMLNAIPGLTNQQLNSEARRMGLSGPEELVELERRRRAQERAGTIKAMTAQASLFELWQEYSIANDKLTLELAGFPADRFTDQVVVDEQDLEAHFEEALETYRIPPQRRYHYIKLDREQVRQGIEPTEEQLRSFFEQNQDRYAQPASIRAEELYLPLIGGEDITTSQALAMMEELRPIAEATEDWSAMDLGEDPIYYRITPRLERATTEYPPPYMRRIEALAEDQVSSPILYLIGHGDEATTNVTLARVIERRDEGVAPMEDIEHRVREDFIHEEALLRFEERRAGIREIAGEVRRADGTIFELAERLGMDDDITTMVERFEFFIPEIGSLYEHGDYIARLREGELSDVLTLPDAAVVLQPTDTVDARYPELDEVRDRVDRAVRERRSGDLARAAAEEALRLIEAGASFEEALADAPIEIATAEPITRTDSLVNLGWPLIDFTRQTLRIDVGSVGMSGYGQAENPAGYAVWRLVELEPATVDQFAEERHDFTRDYLQIQRLAIEREWLRDERARARFELIEANALAP